MTMFYYNMDEGKNPEPEAHFCVPEKIEGFYGFIKKNALFPEMFRVILRAMQQPREEER